MTGRHTYPEAARLLRVDETWLRRHIKQLPHTKLGRVVIFTDTDLERIETLHHHEPQTGPLAAPPRPSGTASLHPLAHLKPLPSRGASRT